MLDDCQCLEIMCLHPCLFLGIQPSCCRTLGFHGCVLGIPRSTRQCKAASVNQPHCLFVKPLESIYSQLPCRSCQGTGFLICDKCEGKGRLGKGGFQKKNPVDLDRITGSKWTALERTFGWRHFIVVSKQRGHGKQWFLEMVATCDKTTHFWINANNLKDRERWTRGWLQRDELMQSSGKTGMNLCKACKGEGKLKCRVCTTSNVDIVEV